MMFPVHWNTDLRGYVPKYPAMFDRVGIRRSGRTFGQELLGYMVMERDLWYTVQHCRFLPEDEGWLPALPATGEGEA